MKTFINARLPARLLRDIIMAAENQIREVKNYLSGLKYIDKLTKSKNEFTVKDILKIHRRTAQAKLKKLGLAQLHIT